MKPVFEVVVGPHMFDHIAEVDNWVPPGLMSSGPIQLEGYFDDTAVPFAQTPRRLTITHGDGTSISLLVEIARHGYVKPRRAQRKTKKALKKPYQQRTAIERRRVDRFKGHYEAVLKPITETP